MIVVIVAKVFLGLLALFFGAFTGAAAYTNQHTIATSCLIIALAAMGVAIFLGE